MTRAYLELRCPFCMRRAVVRDHICVVDVIPPGKSKRVARLAAPAKNFPAIGVRSSQKVSRESRTERQHNTMPAPTALQRVPEALTQGEEVSVTEALGEEDAGVLLDPTASEDTTTPPVQEPSSDADTAMQIDEEGRPKFAPAKDTAVGPSKVETRKIAVPPHRFSPLKNNWIQIYTRVFPGAKE